MESVLQNLRQSIRELRKTPTSTAAAVMALAVACGLATSHAQSGSDWPQWRGATRDGAVTAQLPSEWPAALTKRWELGVGSGHSSPVIAGNRVVVMARNNEQEVVRALDLVSGRERWRAEYPAPYTVNPAARAHGPGPKSTPVIADGRVFTFGIGGVLSAFDLATGRLLWKTPPPAVLPQYGTAMSPLVDGKSVMAHVGGRDDGAITAFDVATGKPRWRWAGDGPGYGSPIIATIGGVRQLITETQKMIVGVNADNGTLLWQLPFTTSANQNAITPVNYKDLVVFSGLEKGTTAVRIQRKESGWAAEQVWKNDEVSMFMSSPILNGTALFGLSHRNRGALFAVDVRSGNMLWSTQGRDGENASLMGSRAWLLVSTTNGELIVARPSATAFEEIRRYQVTDSPMWAHPAVAGRSLIVKGVEKLTCWTF